MGGLNVTNAKTLTAVDDSVARVANKYHADVYELVEENQDMLGAAAEADVKKLHVKAIASHNAHMKAVTEAKHKGLVKKAMLLQIGQWSNSLYWCSQLPWN